MDSGYRPLKKEAREGPQTGYWQNARVNVVPLAASSSNVGVWICW